MKLHDLIPGVCELDRRALLFQSVLAAAAVVFESDPAFVMFQNEQLHADPSQVNFAYSRKLKAMMTAYRTQATG